MKFGAQSEIFSQGEQHDGIYVIESGDVRTYYLGPMGRELTLAYWTPGHFVGGPEIFAWPTHVVGDGDERLHSPTSSRGSPSTIDD